MLEAKGGGIARTANAKRAALQFDTYFVKKLARDSLTNSSIGPDEREVYRKTLLNVAEAGLEV